MTTSALAGLAFFRHKNADHVRTTLIGVQTEIRRLDEVLTMSARMYAATGDAQWRTRYFSNVDQLDSAIAEARELSAKVLGGDFAQPTDVANRALVDLERRSFDLVAAGRSNEATALLQSAEYSRWKSEYAAGMDRLWKALGGQSHRLQMSGRALIIHTMVLGTAGSLAALLVLRTIRKCAIQRRFRAAMTAPDIEERPWLIITGACATLVLCLGLTAFIVQRHHANEIARTAAEFERQADRLATEIQDRLKIPLHLLAGARGVYAASESVTREEFRAYFELRNFTKEFPGAVAFGYVQRVAPDDVDRFVQRERAGGSPDFTVQIADDAIEHYLVTHIEPFTANLYQWGMDLAGNSVCRPAIEQCIRTGETTITSRLSTALDERTAFVRYFMPVYRGHTALSSAEQRDAALDGILFATIDLHALIQDIVGVDNELIDLDVFEGRQVSRDTLVFDSIHDDAEDDGEPIAGIESRLVQRTHYVLRRIGLGGREWTIALSSTPKFDTTIKSVSIVTETALGVVLSGLFALLVWLLGAGRYRAVSLAREMTVELAESKAHVEQALLEAEALRNTIDEQSLVSISDIDGTIIDVNERFCRTTGYAREELLGRNHRILSAGTHSPAFWKHVWTTICGGKSWHGEICSRAKDGRLFWVDATIAPFTDPCGQIQKFVAIRTDITERKRAEDQLRAAALTDNLTKMPNRTLFNARLKQAIARAETDASYHYAVLFLDFDRFKLINDSLGHSKGDRLLNEISERISTTLRGKSSSASRRSDLAARLGGDEFVILLEGIANDDDAVVVAERMLEVLSEPYNLDTQTVQSTVSIGIVTSALGAMTSEEILRNADIAMYEAKAAGRGRYVMFDSWMLERVRMRHRLENDLCTAVENGEFHVAYQPIVCLRTGRILSFEALARWQHPELGPVSPGEFIPIAEETGRIVEVGAFVMEQACDVLKRLRNGPGGENLSMNVNVSRRQLSEPDFIPKLSELLNRLRIPPRCLRVEITESLVMAAPDSIAKSLNDLSAMGVRIHMDDFGTGLSSLSLLRDLPLDGIKIDRSFIDTATGNREAIAVLYAIISLGRDLCMTVTAEGIEDKDQLAMVLALECDLVQGYLFGQPEPINDIEELLNRDYSGHLRSAENTASADALATMPSP
ncbi:MAG: EAL domain-containing protein [Phycisphaerales bacterium]|nr:EAL domain-containing protein [Phycisphaerales bacterium]